MKKWMIIAVVLLLAVLGVAAAIWFVWIEPYYPRYNGRWVYSWADQALLDPNSDARREATENLIPAFRRMKLGEPRIQLLLHFAGRQTVPKEVIPFLVEALHGREFYDYETNAMPGAYVAMALSTVEDGAAIPALIDVIRNDPDSRARAGAIVALRLMGGKAKAAEPDLKRASVDMDHRVREEAERALKEIAEKK
jgi:hypothetical protein